MARLFADENFPNPTVEALRQLGHDVMTAADVGLAGLGIPDEEVLVFAHADGRAVLTHNRKHFRRSVDRGDRRIPRGAFLKPLDRLRAQLAQKVFRKYPTIVPASPLLGLAPLAMCAEP